MGSGYQRSPAKMEGKSFELVDDGDNPIGIGLVGPAGLTIVSLDPESNIVTTRAYGHLPETVLTKTGPIDDGDWNTSYRLTIEHAASRRNGYPSGWQ